MTNRRHEILKLSAQIVAAHAGHNAVLTNSLSQAISNVYSTLRELDDRPHLPESATATDADLDGHNHEAHHNHSVSHAKNAYVHPLYGPTVFEDRLVCMEDGLSMKMLKRHLQTVHGMTPEEYREKWNLPDDYPMVATQYARLRSDLAMQSGLGLKPRGRVVRGRAADKR